MTKNDVNLRLVTCDGIGFLLDGMLGELTVPSVDSFDLAMHLSFNDIQCNKSWNPSIISMNIKQSKTDQSRKGVKANIGPTNNDFCPVSALLKYLGVLRVEQGSSVSVAQWHSFIMIKICERG